MSTTIRRSAIGFAFAIVLALIMADPSMARATEQSAGSMNSPCSIAAVYSCNTAIPLREMYEQVLDTYAIVKYGNNYRIPSWRGTYDICDQTYKMIWFHTGYSETSRTELSRYYDASEDVTTIVMRVNYSTY